jgi:hypothetical protein
MTKKTIGNFSIEYESFPYDGGSRQRPIKVEGTILWRKSGEEAKYPLAHFPDGDFAARPDHMEGMDKGHIIAVEFSQVNSPENIVPMYPSFNRDGGDWRKLERKLRHYVPKYGPRKKIHLCVEVKYGKRREPRVPSSFIVTARDTSTGNCIEFDDRSTLKKS